VARLAGVPGVRLHGPAEQEAQGIVGRKVGVIPFTVDGIDHGLVAAVLGYEHGVGVRHGRFCAQSYIHHLLGVGDVESTRWLDRARADERRGAPGMVRISLGAYNDMADIDRAVRALEWLVAGEVQGRYRADPDGSFVPRRLRRAAAVRPGPARARRPRTSRPRAQWLTITCLSSV
jgi:cysteine desulfurase / selenocysteine lyase